MNTDTHTLIHIGAGQAHELNQWLSRSIAKIVLVEPNPRLAEQLRQRTAEHPQVTVIEAAITTQPTKSQLHTYNVPQTSSLNQATGLKNLYPGLRIIHSQPVSILSPTELFDQYVPSTEQAVKLLITAAGEEMAIIQDLIRSQRLQQCTQLQLVASTEPMYEDGASASELLNRLQESGFIVQQSTPIDREWSRWYLQRNPLIDQINHLQNTVQQQQAQLEQAQKAVETEENAAKIATEAKQKSEQALLTVRAELDFLKAEQTTQIQELESVIAATKNALAKEQETVQQQKNQLEEINKELANNKNWFKNRKEQAEKLELALETEKKAIKAVTEEKQKDEQALLTVRAELDSLKAKQATQIQELESVITATKNALAKEQETVQQQKNQFEKINKELANNKNWFKSRKEQAEKLELALKKEKEVNEKLIQEKESIQNLQERLEQLFTQQSAQIQQATNALGKHISQSFVDQNQQQQAMTGFYQYLENGIQPFDFNEWTIGIDVANYLVRLVEQNNYDFIIEFGSGTSTLVLAKAVAQHLNAATTSSNKTKNQLNYEDIETRSGSEINATQASSLLDTAVYDLPRRILSFEQSKQYFNQTKQALASHGLSNLVDLVLAPLVSTTHTQVKSADQPLFYDCIRHLERVAQLYDNRAANILVLVDGPFSPTQNPLAREPALATLLQHFSTHTMDILLDDTKREGEQQVLNHWLQLGAERGLEWRMVDLRMEKGMCLLRLGV